jgi:CarD family transcriptional regulator
MAVEFEINELVVYPAYGVARIIAVEHKNIGDFKQNFYVLKVLDNEMSLMVPTTNTKNVGMRKLVTSDEADKALETLKKRERVSICAPWNRRQNDYMDKIRSGCVFEVASVLRELYVLKADKELSFGERKMLDTAKSIFTREISIAKGVSVSEVENKFKTIFKY